MNRMLVTVKKINERLEIRNVIRIFETYYGIQLNSYTHERSKVVES